MFLVSFKAVSIAILQIFILGLIGFVLVRRKLLNNEGLQSLSRLVIFVTLPLLIISRFIKDFSFSLYPNWWIFPILSFCLTALGFLSALIFIRAAKCSDEKRQFISLVAFQNSGYLPLALVAAMLPQDQAAQMFIYIFLFLVGFNLLIWSLGPYILSYHRDARFEFGKLFSPPVIATLIGLLLVFSKAAEFIPGFIHQPLKTVGECTLPLAIFVIGGSLAGIELKRKINQRAIFFLLLAKLIIMPAIVLLLISRLEIAYLLGMLLIIQAAMPPAVSLSIIIRQSEKEDYLINSAIFIGHIVSIFSVPLFLTLFFFMIQ